MRDLIPIFVVVGLALWAWASLRLGRAAQPLRLKLAEQGGHLLSLPGLSARQRDLVKYNLATAFGHRTALLLGLFIVPAYAVTILFRPRTLEQIGKRFTIEDSATRIHFHEVMRLHNRITFLNHPILVMLLDLEITLFIAPAIMSAAIFSGSTNEKVSHDSAMGLIDEKTIALSRHIPLRLLPA